MISAIIKLLKPIWKWVLGFTISLIISNVLAWILQHASIKLIDKFDDSITKFIKEKNNFILTTIFNINDFLNNATTPIFTYLDNVCADLETWIVNQLEASGSFIESAISNSSFISKIEEITQNTVNSAGTFIFNTSTTIINNISLESLKNKVNDALNQLDDLELYIFEQITIFYENLLNEVQNKMNQLSNMMTAFEFTTNNTVSFCNNSIDQMISNMDNVCDELDNYNINLEQRKIDALHAIENNSDNNSDNNTIRDILKNILFAPVPDALNMDFAQYRISPPDIDRTQYYANFALPPNNSNIDITGYLPDFSAMNTELTNIITMLENINQDMLDAIESGLPAILKGSLEAGIKNLIFVVLLEALYQKKTEIMIGIDTKIMEILSKENEYKQNIISIKNNIVTALQSFEQSQYQAIKILLDSETEEIIQDLDNGIVEHEDENIINIDDILPDTTSIDHIIEKFNKNISANEQANITNSAKWTSADIYRLLCNHFWRSERVALIAHLFSQDLNINREKLKELQVKWTPPETIQ